jgi:hypothetical protein
MATNENQIGVTAKFDIDEFSKNLTLYLAKLNQANTGTETFYKKQETEQKKSTEATKKTAAAQTSAMKGMVDQYASMAVRLTVIFGSIILVYKKLQDAATRLGDQDAIAGFDAMNESVMNLGDSLTAMLFDFAKVGDVLDFMASGITALNQLLILAGGEVAKYATMWIEFFSVIGRRLGEISQGKIFTSDMDIGAELSKIMPKAEAARNSAILAGVQAPEKVKATAAQKDIDKQLKDDLAKQREYYAKLEDLQIKSGEDILSAEKDLQEKSASAWTDYIEKTTEIISDGIEKRAELQTTYTDAVRSAEADYQRSTEDAAYSHGQKLLDVERQYQEAIVNVERDYQQESLDAARNLDAIAFVRAREKRDTGLQDATRNRDVANASEAQNYQRQLFELQRSLSDKKRDAEDAYRRGLDDQRRAEQEAQNSAKSAYNKQLNDAQDAFNQRIAAIRASYANEDATAQAHYLNQESLLQAHLVRMRNIMASYGMYGGTVGSGAGNPTGMVQERAKGGLDIVSRPTQFLAGEAGPEMVYTVPMARNVPVAASQVVNHVGEFDHRIESTIKSSVAGMDGRITAAVTKVLREVLG